MMRAVVILFSWRKGTGTFSTSTAMMVVRAFWIESAVEHTSATTSTTRMPFQPLPRLPTRKKKERKGACGEEYHGTVNLQRRRRTSSSAGEH